MRGIGHCAKAALATALILLAATPAVAAEDGGKGDSAPAEKSEAKPDAYGRENPRTMQIGLLQSISSDDPARLAEYLEVDDPASPAAADRAAAFKAFLDAHGTLVSRISLSLEPEGDLEDGLPPETDSIGEMDIAGEKVPILVHRVAATGEAGAAGGAGEDSEGGARIWLVSAETLARVPQLHVSAARPEVAGTSEDEHTLMLFGAPLGSWAVLAGVSLAIFALIVLSARAVLHTVVRRAGHLARHPVADLLYSTVPPLALMIVYRALAHFAEPLGAGLVERTMLARFSGMVFWIAGVWFLWRLVGVLNRLVDARLRRTGNTSQIGPIDFAVRLARFALLLIAGAIFLSTFGIDVTAGLAALGVGGLALALGARTAVENLIGGITILTDKPVRVGDKCEVNGQVGYVEEIGILSTRIRTRERTLLSIPNSKFAENEIENLTERDRFLVEQTFGVPLDCKGERIEQVLQTVRDALEADENYLPSTSPVRFRGFGAGCMNIQIHAYLRSKDHDEGYWRQERFLLDLMRRFEALDIVLVPPAQTIVVARGEA